MCPGRVLELRELSAGNIDRGVLESGAFELEMLKGNPRPIWVGFSFEGSTHSSGTCLDGSFGLLGILRCLLEVALDSCGTHEPEYLG